MILSTKKKNLVKFRPATSCTYLSDSKFSAVKHSDGKIYIQMGTCIPLWQTGFSCIECAEDFLNAHDPENITEDSVPYSSDDFEYIIDLFGFKFQGDNVWTIESQDKNVVLRPDEKELVLTVEEKGRSTTTTYTNSSDLISELEDVLDEQLIFSNCIIVSKSDTYKIICAASPVRELTKNIVRVKSSNIWGYGINIKDRKDKVGDVVVQFKGRNGGPNDIYIYYDVPIKLWRMWLTSPSKGHFFWVNIRNNFKYSKLTGDRKTHLRNGISR